ncbi:MAG: glycosyltransferase family 1 protein [Ktedonobacterales bacterium]|nr:glycosyltransferase family 1 protein [Ktedonobacterales bacterium]
MARIVITTFGSSGDLNPFLALGLELRARGHDVRFAVEESMRPPLTDHGFTIHHLTGDGQAALGPYTRQMLGAMNPFASVRLIVEKYILPTLPTKVEELRSACADADLLVSAAVQIAASFVADLVALPWASIALSPVTLPSDYLEPQPPFFPLPAWLQRFYNHTGWALGDVVLRRMVDVPVNTIRAEFGLPPRRDIMQYGNLSTELTAVAISPAFCPPPPDWPAYVRTTGFCFWDTPGDWSEPPELTEFLSGERPVVAVSTGSMAPEMGDAFARFYQTSLEAIQGVGARALVIGAAPGILPYQLPEDVLALPFAPFSHVYPRCAAVIHHGGIGTTAQGLRAGVPALIIPWGADQFFDGAQVQRIGAGRWMQRRFYSVPRATSALDRLLRDARYAAGARAAATRIAAEDGVTALCDTLEALLQRTG